MAPSLVEEAFEAVEAIETATDPGAVEEMGDLLMVIALISRIASEEGRFDLGAVADGVADKLIRRHPHVFGDINVDGSEQAIANWEAIKQAERRSKEADASALAGVPVALPALQRCDRIAGKAIAAGFRWQDTQGAFVKVQEEVGELARELEASEPDRERVESELGDVLLAAAFLGRYLDIDPERAVKASLRRFEERFRSMERAFEGEMREASLEDLIAAWGRAKKETA